MKNLPYSNILIKIDALRTQGVSEDDPRIKELKKQLWLQLNKRNKNKSDKKIIPKVTAVKTLTFKPDSFAIEKVKEESKEKPELGEVDKSHITKYLLLGAVIGVACIIYKFAND